MGAFASGPAVFVEAFSYPDGVLRIVAPGTWGGPFVAENGDLSVVSGQVANPLEGTYRDAYTVRGDLGPGDYALTLPTRISEGHHLFFHVLADLSGNSYVVNLQRQDAAPTPSERWRFSRRTPVSYGTPLIDVTRTTRFIDGDGIGVRVGEGAATVSLYHLRAGAVLGQVGEEVTPALLSPGRVAIESESSSMRLDELKVYALEETTVRARGQVVAGEAVQHAAVR